MKYMATYDMMEAMRNTNQWLGATAKSMAAYPMFSLMPNPALQWLGAWGDVTERSFERMIAKPDWGLDSFTCADGRDHLIDINTVCRTSFWRFDSLRRHRSRDAAAQDPSGRANVRPLRDTFAINREILDPRCGSLRYRLAQCPRHSSVRW